MNRTRAIRRLLLITTLAALLAAFVAQSASARGGTTGGGGSSVPTLAADFPTADVPLPTGKLMIAQGASPRWSMQYIVDGNYPDVFAGLQAYYTGLGFSEPAGEFSVYNFTRGNYRVTVWGASHDHSATATDVIVQVNRI